MSVSELDRLEVDTEHDDGDAAVARLLETLGV